MQNQIWHRHTKISYFRVLLLHPSETSGCWRGRMFGQRGHCSDHLGAPYEVLLLPMWGTTPRQPWRHHQTDWSNDHHHHVPFLNGGVELTLNSVIKQKSLAANKVFHFILMRSNKVTRTLPVTQIWFATLSNLITLCWLHLITYNSTTNNFSSPLSQPNQWNLNGAPV